MDRLFYDARQPVMLSEAQVRAMSTAECAAASEQLDQHLVSVLQDIDENFVRATRIITERILPALEAYGEASRDIWQSVKFWQTFFEAAAGIRFTEDGAEAPTGQEDASNVSSRDVTLRADSPEDDADATLSLETRTQPTVFANELSDLDLLHQQIKQQFGTSSLPSPHPSLDLTGDDILQPELETLSLGDLPGTRRVDKGKGRAQPAELLQQVLLKNTSSVKNATSTPARSRGVSSVAVPPEAADPAWSGLLDLGKTPLAAFSPSRRKSPATKETNDSFDIEPPVLHHFSLPRSKAALARTPAKEAAKLVARDALEAAALRGAGDVDSPLLEPPSVLRNWATRGYGGDQDAPSPSRSAPGPSRPAPSNLLAGDEDDGADLEDSLVEMEAPWDDGFGEEEEASVSFAARNPLDEDDGPLDDTVELDFDAAAEAFPAEDTLFGGRRATLGLGKAADRRSADFRLRGPQGDEMATLHGGALSDAQPFQRSPLAGRDPKYGL